MDNVTPGNPPDEMHLKDYNYLALILGIPLILVIILGNVLVCLSVLTERSLKTATNYFIISLAVADLLLAVLVLPLYVYSEFLGGIWTLSTSICDGLMTMDVMLCTASILNLCAISVDRYIAVVVPLKYNRNQFSVRQLALITATWVLSLGVATPVIFGLNQVPGRDPRVCKLEDDRFVVYSSVCSFFVPCPVMLFLYYWMFRGLRRWSGRSRSPADRAGRPALSLRLGSALQRAKATTTGGLEKVVYATPTGLSPTSPSTVSTMMPSMTPVMEEHQDRAVVMAESDPMTMQMDSVSDGEATERREGLNRENGLMKISPAAKRGRRNSKSSRVSGRERKAMKVLPVVVGVFLACWTPFFVVHVTKVLCQSCDIGPTLISVVTWLGYVNSAINPIIYTAFNAEFRNVFHKLLCCRT
ncbi:dopamine receptor D4 related sequence [Xiphias gladius]|uniref:dopamine receptor D4 related sequence n=1 Tax=Xiphias gladius TaxID=8245 RepID=UPI001A995C5A|nr:dopamine receptor D4 related sequence [Xiphias gladius]XP_040003851.1 dopamine receptor D4 related sequence [Xiphias gladius]